MKKLIYTLIAFVFMASMALPVLAGEHGGKEHGGSPKGSMHEHGGEAVKAVEEVKAEPTDEEIRSTMKNFVEFQSEHHGGKYNVKDPDTGEILGLELEKVHERVGKTGDYYYSCADFKDDEGKMWDLDIDVQDRGGKLTVVDVRIHKENGIASYTYDDKDDRHPIVEGTKRHLGKNADSMEEEVEHKGSMKGSSHEHGGN